MEKFDNFKQRQLSMGMETCSTTEYKGYNIFLRAYINSGIKYKIIKPYNGKNIILREKAWWFMKPNELLQKAKDYIDNHEVNLIEKFNNKIK